MAALKHIAFIMDGNGRWAQSRGLERLEGHRKGAAVVKSVVDFAEQEDIPYVTFYAFSIENWRRPISEVNGLMALMREFFKKELMSIKKRNFRIRFIGDRSPQSQLPQDIADMMDFVERETEENTGLQIIFAINYGSRDELVRAMQGLAQDVELGRRYVGDIDEEAVSLYLDTGGIPDPDVIVRTGGEKRLSNYLLWQAAYAELFFLDVSWPDLNAEHLYQVLQEFGGRDRRFGGLKNQAV